MSGIPGINVPDFRDPLAFGRNFGQQYQYEDYIRQMQAARDANQGGPQGGGLPPPTGPLYSQFGTPGYVSPQYAGPGAGGVPSPAGGAPPATGRGGIYDALNGLGMGGGGGGGMPQGAMPPPGMAPDMSPPGGANSQWLAAQRMLGGGGAQTQTGPGGAPRDPRGFLGNPANGSQGMGPGSGNGVVGGLPAGSNEPQRYPNAVDFNGRTVYVDDLGHGDFGEGYDSVGNLAIGSRGTGPTSREMTNEFNTLKTAGLVFWPGSYSTWFAAGKPLANSLTDAEKNILSQPGGDWNKVMNFRMNNPNQPPPTGQQPPPGTPGVPPPAGGGNNPPNWLIPGLGNAIGMPAQIPGYNPPVPGQGGYPPLNPGFGDGGLGSNSNFIPGGDPASMTEKIMQNLAAYGYPPGTTREQVFRDMSQEVTAFGGGGGSMFGPANLDRGRGGMPQLPKGNTGGEMRYASAGGGGGAPTVEQIMANPTAYKLDPMAIAADPAGARANIMQGLAMGQYRGNNGGGGQGGYNPQDAMNGRGYQPPAFAQPSYDQKTYPGMTDDEFQRLLAWNNNMALPWSEFIAGRYQNDRDFGEDTRRFGINFGEDKRRFDTNFGEDQYRDRRNYDTDVFRDTRDYGENVRRYDEGFGEDRRRFDTNFGEDTRRFDLNRGDQNNQWGQEFGEGQRQFDQSQMQQNQQFGKTLDWTKVSDAMRTFGSRQMPNVRQMSFR